MNTNRIVLAAGVALDILNWASKARAADSEGGDKITPGEVANVLEQVGNKILKEEGKKYRIIIDIKEVSAEHDELGIG